MEHPVAHAELEVDYCPEQSKRGVVIFCDFIMGDETVKCMRRMVSCAAAEISPVSPRSPQCFVSRMRIRLMRFGLKWRRKSREEL